MIKKAHTLNKKSHREKLAIEFSKKYKITITEDDFVCVPQNSETISKITKPGLWFIKSRQPLFDISSFISNFVIDGPLKITIYTTEEKLLKNEVMHRFFNNQEVNYPDDYWFEQDLSEHLECEVHNSTKDLMENFNSEYDSSVDIRTYFDLSCCNLNSSFNPILIDYPSILLNEREPQFAKELINEENSFMETGHSIIVFLPVGKTSFSLDFIDSRILNLE